MRKTPLRNRRSVSPACRGSLMKEGFNVKEWNLLQAGRKAAGSEDAPGAFMPLCSAFRLTAGK